MAAKIRPCLVISARERDGRMLSGCPRSSFLSSQPIVPPLTCRATFVGPGATFCDAAKPPNPNGAGANGTLTKPAPICAEIEISLCPTSGVDAT